MSEDRSHTSVDSLSDSTFESLAEAIFNLELRCTQAAFGYESGSDDVLPAQTRYDIDRWTTFAHDLHVDPQREHGQVLSPRLAPLLATNTYVAGPSHDPAITVSFEMIWTYWERIKKVLDLMQLINPFCISHRAVEDVEYMRRFPRHVKRNIMSDIALPLTPGHGELGRNGQTFSKCIVSGTYFEDREFRAATSLNIRLTLMGTQPAAHPGAQAFEPLEYRLDVQMRPGMPLYIANDLGNESELILLKLAVAMLYPAQSAQVAGRLRELKVQAFEIQSRANQAASST